MSQLPNICGFNKTSESGLDVFAPSIFLSGCNFKCPYCMNAKLVRAIHMPPISIDEVRNYVIQEKCEWVNISGGEPTVTDTTLLINLIDEIRSWNCRVGMSTNGSKPLVINEIVSKLNYVAMDIKCVREEDSELILGNKKPYFADIVATQSIMASNKLNRKNFDYEIRTTLFPKFIDALAINEIGSILRKDDKWVLQQFRHSQNMLDNSCKNIKPYTEEEVNKLVELAKKYCNVQLKYV